MSALRHQVRSAWLAPVKDRRELAIGGVVLESAVGGCAGVEEGSESGVGVDVEGFESTVGVEEGSEEGSKEGSKSRVGGGVDIEGFESAVRVEEGSEEGVGEAVQT
jgi:hypothetical protein